MSDTPTLPESVIAAFHLMWSKFSRPVTLVHKSRTVMAANAAGIALGRVPGVKCSTLPSTSSHKGCLGNKALSEGRTKLKKLVTPEYECMVYWVPIEGYPDYFLHFSTDVSDPDEGLAAGKA